jgi:DNA (cytosine-5)-methyltransferase 3A
MSGGKKEKINVLSLFDGISCGMIALERAGFKVENYYSSEIDKQAISISNDNYPNIKRLGSVKNWKEWDIDWKSIVIIIGECYGSGS